MTSAVVTTITPLPITEPIVLADPYKGSHVLRWNKSRGQPDSARGGLSTNREASFTQSVDDDIIDNVPYRLPRISPQDDELEREHLFSDPDVPPDKVWSRYGYERVIRIPELGPQIKMLMPPPRNYLQQYRQATTPRYKSSAVARTVRSLPWHLGRGAEDQPLHSYRGNHTRQAGESLRTPRLEPTPTPVMSRSESPAKSIRSINWVLGNNRYHSFDRQGRCLIQGPYSREFNVTCMAPANWMRMKWGRSKTMVK